MKRRTKARKRWTRLDQWQRFELVADILRNERSPVPLTLAALAARHTVCRTTAYRICRDILTTPKPTHDHNRKTLPKA